MTTEQAIVFLADQIEEETTKTEAYRQAAIALIDHIADEAAYMTRRLRKERREYEAKVVNATANNTTH